MSEPMTHGGTTMPESFAPRTPKAGVIKIGDVIKTGQGDSARIRPEKLDHFRICGPQPTQDGQYPDHPDFVEENKAKPTKIKIEFISDNPEVNLELNRVYAHRDTILCKGTGTVAHRRQRNGKDDPLGEFAPMPEGTCGDHCPYAKSRKCKISSTLRFRIPGHTPMGWIWEFRSSGWNSAQNLLGSMRDILALTDGVLARMPIHMMIQEERRKILNQAKDGRMSTKFWSVSIAYLGEEEDLLADLERVMSIRKRYEALGKSSDVMEKEILSARASGNILGDLVADRDTERAFALEYFPESEDGTLVSNLGTTRPAMPTPPPAVEPPKAEPKPEPKAEPKPAPRAKAASKAEAKTPDADKAREIPDAVQAYAAMNQKVASFAEFMVLAQAAMVALTYKSSEGGTLSEDDRRTRAIESGDTFAKSIDEFAEICAGDNDAIADFVMTKLDEMVDLMEHHGAKIRTAPVTNPAAAHPEPAAKPATKDKALPTALEKLYQDAHVAMETIRNQNESDAKVTIVRIRQFHNKFGEVIGLLDHDGKRVARSIDDNDTIWKNRQAKGVNALRAENPKAADKSPEKYHLLAERLWREVTLEVAAWKTEA